MLIKKPKKIYQIIILIIAQFLLLVATSISQPFWPLILKQQTPSPELSYPIWNTLVYMLPLLFMALTAPLWGSLADRYGYKKLLLRATLCLFITQGLLIFARNPLQSCLCLLLQGAFSGSIAASQALGTRLASKQQQSMVISQLQSMIALGMMVGPVIGGYIFEFYAYPALFKISVLLCLVASLLLFYFIEEPAPREPTHTLDHQAHHSRSHRYLIPISIFLAQIARFMILPIFALYVTTILREKIPAIGILYGASSMTLFICAPCIGKLFDRQRIKNKNRYWLPSIALFIAFLLYAILPDTKNYTLAFLNRCLWGCCLSAITPLLYSINMDCYAEHARGKAIGLASSANKLGSLCGILLGSFFAYQFDLKFALHMIAYVYLLNCFYLIMLNLKSIRLTALNIVATVHALLRV